MTYHEQADEQAENRRFSLKNDISKRFSNIFNTSGSAGQNPEKLAKILIAHDTFMHIMGWDIDKKDENGNTILAKPLSKLSAIVTNYQASTGSNYHKDFVEVLRAEQIFERDKERKGLTIMGQ